MYVTILIMLGSIVVGFFIRNTPLPGWIARLIMPVIYALLFCMGVVIGANPQIMQSLDTIGLSGMLIAFCTVIGSIAATYFFSVFVLKKR